MRRLFAIGDIHGCFNPFHELVVKIIGLRKNDRLILLGDYIDRGPRSREVVDFIMDLIRKGFDIIPLTGNHEAMLLESYNDPGLLYQWFMNSGETTLSSFGVADVRNIDLKYIEFFAGLKYYQEDGEYLFVHAGFNDEEKDPFTDRYHMIWESRNFYKNPRLTGKIIVHGHRPKTIEYVKKQIREKARVLPVDTGCVYDRGMGYGHLSALQLPEMALFSVPDF